MDLEYESVLLIVRECYVYKIPPRATNKGYKASDWDVNNFIWKGRLRVVSVNDRAYVKLEDPSTGELFAKCEHSPETNSVEPVTDSSRYFVLRIEDNGKHAFIGLGFQERTESFDFNVCLQDFVKHIRAEKASQEPNQVDSEPKMDYSLKAGEQISISIGNIPKRATNKPRSTENVSPIGSAPLPFLPPPPSVSVAKQQMKHHNTGVGVFGATTDQFGRPLTGDVAGKAGPAAIAVRKQGENDWGDFGDFTGGRTNNESTPSSTTQWTSFA